MSTTVFNLVIESDLIRNEEDALTAFYNMALSAIEADFDYDFDYDFIGNDDEGYWYKVYVDAETQEDACEVMTQKFEDNVPRGVYAEYNLV